MGDSARLGRKVFPNSSRPRTAYDLCYRNALGCNDYSCTPVMAKDLKSAKCRFESDWGHRVRSDNGPGAKTVYSVLVPVIH